VEFSKAVTTFRKVRKLISGEALDPRTRQAVAIAPLFALIGLGADGLSSACYGPEEAFLALGQHTPLALLLASATAATVFIISFGYSQIIELFAAGGGGYRVATELLGPRCGVVSGAALLVDYVLPSRHPSAWLHNRTPTGIQRRLQSQGRRMVLLPMKIG
jgi:amino acid transporter